MGERLMRASADSTDRVEAHESKITAAVCSCWAGRFDPATDAARQAMADAARLSPHRALHSAMAQTFCLARQAASPSSARQQAGSSSSRAKTAAISTPA